MPATCVSVPKDNQARLTERSIGRRLWLEQQTARARVAVSFDLAVARPQAAGSVSVLPQSSHRAPNFSDSAWQLLPVRREPCQDGNLATRRGATDRDQGKPSNQFLIQNDISLFVSNQRTQPAFAPVDADAVAAFVPGEFFNAGKQADSAGMPAPAYAVATHHLAGIVRCSLVEGAAKIAILLAVATTKRSRDVI